MPPIADFEPGQTIRTARELPEHEAKAGPPTPDVVLDLVDTHVPTERSIGDRLTPDGDPMIQTKAKLLPEGQPFQQWSENRDSQPVRLLVVTDAVATAVHDGDVIVWRHRGDQNGAMRVIGRQGNLQSHTPGHFNGKTALLAQPARDTVTAWDEVGERNAAARRWSDAARRANEEFAARKRQREHEDAELGKNFAGLRDTDDGDALVARLLALDEDGWAHVRAAVVSAAAELPQDAPST